MLQWSEGPHEHGCVYHKRGVCPLGADALVVDVLIMPSIVKTRPIAITIGRYRHDKPMRTEQWQLDSPRDLSPVGREVPLLLTKIGVRPENVPSLTTAIEQLLMRESATLEEVLSSVRAE
jgi:hypothetical protein